MCADDTAVAQADDTLSIMSLTIAELDFAIACGHNCVNNSRAEIGSIIDFSLEPRAHSLYHACNYSISANFEKDRAILMTAFSARQASGIVYREAINRELALPRIDSTQRSSCYTL